jgi:thiamine biosynthesis lipoprotein ApbE
MKKRSAITYVLVFLLVFAAGFGSGGAFESYRSYERSRALTIAILKQQKMIEERNQAIKKYGEIMQKVIQAMKEQEAEIDRLNALKNSI